MHHVNMACGRPERAKVEMPTPVVDLNYSGIEGEGKLRLGYKESDALAKRGRQEEVKTQQNLSVNKQCAQPAAGI